MVDNAVVGRWIKMWLRAWRSERVVLVSPLPVEEARARLIEGRTTYLRAALTFGGWGERRVVGRIGTRRVSLQAVTVGIQNSWRPVLRGSLEPDGTGSRLVGRLGVSPFVTAFCAVWLTCVVCVFVFVTSRGVAAVWSGEAAAGEAFLFCLIPVGFVAFFVGLTSWGMKVGRREGRHLLSWLNGQLQTADSGIRGYRPWQQTTRL